jgi:mRNA interferase RelE/StbE
MSYRIVFDKPAVKKLLKIDPKERLILLAWIKKNLEGCENPRLLGKQLSGDLNHYWRYRVGDYRIVVRIKDNELVIIVISLGHRKDIYEKL